MAIADNTTLTAVSSTSIRRPIPKRVVFAAAGLAVVCGAATFLLPQLSEHPATRIIVNDKKLAASQAVNAVSAASTTANSKASSKEETAPASLSPSAPKANGPSNFLLSRSGRYQVFGPLKLRLGRTDPKRGLYDLTVSVGARSFVHRNVRVNEALWVSLPKSNSAAQIVVTRVQPDLIVGYWNGAPRPTFDGSARKK